MTGRARAGWRQLAGTGAGSSAVLGLLVLGCVFLAVAGPRASLLLRSRALHQALAAAPLASSALVAQTDSFSFTVPGTHITAAQDSATRQTVRRYLSARGLPISAGTAWAAVATGYRDVTGAAPRASIAGHPPQLQLAYRDPLAGHARLAAGHWPATAAATAAGTVTLEAAVTTATAARYGLAPGSRLSMGPGLAVTVTGVLAPADPGSAFWTEFAGTAAPALFTEPPSAGGQSYWQAAAFIGPGELAALQAGDEGSDLTLDWVYPLRVSALSATGAGPLATRLAAAGTDGATMPGNIGGLSISTGLSADLTAFAAADQAVGTLLSLLEVSLAVLSAAVLALTARLLTAQRAAEYALMRARGAAPRQLAGRALRGGVAAAGPAALIAAAAAVVVTPAASTPLAWWLGGLVTAFALAGPPVLAARSGAAGPGRAGPGWAGPGWAGTGWAGTGWAGTGWAGGGAGAGSVSAGRRLAAARRAVIDAGLIAVAVAGLAVLRAEGTSGGDAYTAAGPVLAAVPAAVLAARLAPAVVTSLARLARRRRGVVTFVGLARGAAAGQAAALPVFALVLALTVAAFATMVTAAMRTAEVAAAWQQVPASAVIGGPADSIALTAAAQRAVAAVPGAGPVAAIRQTPGSLTAARFGGTGLTVAVVSPRPYAAALAGTPDARFDAAALARPSRPGGPVPVLASPAAARLLGRAPTQVLLGTGTLTIRVAGPVGASTPAGAGAGGPFVVLPLWGAAGQAELAPSIMLVGGTRVSQRALLAAVAATAPGVPVSFHSRVLAGLQAAPLPHAAAAAFAAGTVAAAGLSALVLVIMLVLGGRARELTLARLATMGLFPGQARRLAATEIAVPVLAAAAGGAACALALVPLLAPVIRLAAVTGTAGAALHADLPVLAVVAGGLVVLAAAVLAAQGAVAARRGTSRALRISG